MMALLAALSGVSVVVGRMLNAQAALWIGTRRSTINNYLFGLAAALPMMWIAGESLAMPAENGFLMYLGGAVSVAVVAITAYASLKISSMRMTLLSFVTQLAAAILLDTLISGKFDVAQAAGGALVFVGLWVETRGSGDKEDAS